MTSRTHPDRANVGNLAMALGDTKTQLIRRAFEGLGIDARPVDVAASLQAQGVTVSPSHVSRVKRSMTGQYAESGARQPRLVGPETRIRTKGAGAKTE